MIVEITPTLELDHSHIVEKFVMYIKIPHQRGQSRGGEYQDTPNLSSGETAYKNFKQGTSIIIFPKSREILSIWLSKNIGSMTPFHSISSMLYGI